PQNIDADAAFDDKESESEVHVSPSSSDKPKKHDEKAKREAKGKSPVELSTGVRVLSDELEEFSVDSTNRVNAASAPVTAVGPNSTNSFNAASTPVTAVGPNSTNSTNSFNAAGPSDNAVSPNFAIGGKSSFVDPFQYPDDPNMPALEDIIYSDDEEDVGAEADFSNLETSITVSPIPTTRVHKDHPVTQIIGDLSSAPQTRKPKRVQQALKDPSWIKAMQEELLQFKMQKEEGIDYEEVFALVARIEGLRLFLAYASFMGFMVYQMDVKSAFLYETIKEEVYVYQSPGFEDLDYPDKVHMDDIIFGSINKGLCKAFEKLMKDKFQMSSMGELTFFLGLQVKQNDNGIFISQDKYVAEILRKFGLTDRKSASTPIDNEKPLLKDPDGEDVDVHIYRSMIGSLMYLTSSRPDIMFAICACARFQVAPKVLHLHAVKRIFRLIITAISSKLMLFGLTIDAAYLMLLGHKYALMVNPTIYVSCIKQFWTSVSIKNSNDVVRLQALIDRKKVIITEDTIRQYLRLDDAAGVDCLPNEEIFAELASMGYEKSSIKLTFYKAFFSAQWKFLIYIIFDDLSSHNTKYTSPALIQKVFANIKRTGKGFSEVDTPLFDGMLVQQQVQDVEDATEDEDDNNAVSTKPTLPSPTPATPPPSPTQEHILSPPQTQIAQPLSPPLQQPLQTTDNSQSLMTLLNTLLKTCATLTKQVANLEQDKIAQAIEIIKLKQRVRRRMHPNKGEIAKLDADEDVTLVDTEEDINADVQGRLVESQAKVYHLDLQHAEKVISMQDPDEAEPVKVEEVIEVVTAAKLMTKVVTAAQVPKASALRKRRGVVIQDPKEIATALVSVHLEVKFKDKGKGILIKEPKPLKRQAQIKQDEAFARQLEAKLNANINWDDVMEQAKRKEKQNKTVMRYQALKRKHITKTQARKNMMIYLKNMAGFKMDFFKAKKQKIDEETEELKTYLQIIANDDDDDDDVYTEATPLALKRRLGDALEACSRKISIFRAKEFSDDFLLNTLKIMFEKPNIEASIWRDQRDRHGLAKVKSLKLFKSCRVHIITLITTQMILLVEKKYPLTRFTLEQMLNNVRLEVEEESEMSLELLRLVRRQLQEGYIPD
nr:hypothetical protein [Tanacetum cinerariifolium]